VPVYGFMKRNWATRAFLSGWTIGTVDQYASGTLLAAPGSNNGIGTYLPGSSSREVRVPGVSLYTHDINSTFDPNTPNPGAGNIPGALIFAGSGPGSREDCQVS